MREKFIVEGLDGAKKLKGDIAVRGAKNAALKFLAATILFEDEVRFSNVPNIEDVHRSCELLRSAGAEVLVDKDAVTVQSTQKFLTELDPEISKRMRASIVFTGPMLARMGEVSFPYPGGCVLGERPIDLFISGFEAFGATVEEIDEVFHLRAKNGLKGAHIFFPFVSVGATETMMYAAALAHGETILENVAMEPEIIAQAQMLKDSGLQIEGFGTSTIRIIGTGGKPLHANGKTFAVLPDRLESGSFLLLAALAAEDVTISKCEPKHLRSLTNLLSRAGVSLEIGENTIRVRATNKPYKSVSVRTHEYPGFPTDLQAPMAVFLTQCNGEATILETIYDGRFRYAEDLAKVGADMAVMNPHRVLIRGPRKLAHAKLESPDIRAGLAYILATAIAHGTSEIDNAYLIDRGYENIEERLRGLGLNILREKSE